MGVGRSHWPLRYILLGAFVVLCVIYIIAPLAVVIFNSFNSVAYNVFPPKGLSLRWYVHLAQQQEFYGAAWLSLVLGVTSSVLAVVAGTMASYALVRYALRAKGFLNSLLLAPIVVPKMVLGVGLFMFFARIHIYGNFGSLMFAHALISMPFVVALVSASLMGADRSLEEAALDLGATPVIAFLRVTLPQIATSVVVGGLFAFIVSFDQLESTIFLTRPGSTTLPIAMYNYNLKWQDPTIAALSTFVIAFSVLLVIAVGPFLKGVDVSALERGGRSEIKDAS